MKWDVAGVGNALMDALVVIDNDKLLGELGLTRGTMHPVDHSRWQEVYERVRLHGVTFDSGGSCANTIATVGRLGGNSRYCGQVGDDQMGHLYAKLIEKACGGHALHFTKEAQTGKCLSIISKSDAERTMLTDLGAAVSLPSLGDFEAELQQTRVAHFTGYTLLDGPMQAVALSAMKLAKAAGAAVSLDVADPFVVGTIKELLWTVLAEHCDIVFLNAEEAKALADVEHAEDAVAAIRERLPQLDTIVVKLGSKGSMVSHKGEVTRIEINPVKAVDTTGAGDAYAGGYLYGYAKDWSPAKAGHLASEVAGLTVAQIGAVVKDPELLAAALKRVEG